jgi:hypothetical protein
MQNNSEENKNEFKNKQIKIGSSMWFLQWGCLLSTVFLAGSSLNFLFQWLAYGYSWDAGGLIFSLILAILVYVFALTPGRIASLSKRGLVAVFSIVIWAVCLPMVMKVLGY